VGVVAAHREGGHGSDTLLRLAEPACPTPRIESDWLQMFSLLGVLFLFRFGSVPPHEAEVSFRAQAHQIAIENVVRSSPLTDGPAGAAPHGLDLPLLYGAGPVVGPLRPAYRPSDWVSAVVHQLDLAEHPLGRAAIWLSEIPVQVDARPSRVCVRLTFRGF